MLPQTVDNGYRLPSQKTHHSSRVSASLQLEPLILISLKLGNLFLTERLQIKVGDFGLAAQMTFDGERKRTVCGTPNYIAPEILDSSKPSVPGLVAAGHSYEVDYWSIGVILYTMLVGRPPFESSEVN